MALSIGIAWRAKPHCTRPRHFVERAAATTPGLSQPTGSTSSRPVKSSEYIPCKCWVSKLSGKNICHKTSKKKNTSNLICLLFFLSETTTVELQRIPVPFRCCSRPRNPFPFRLRPTPKAPAQLLQQPQEKGTGRSFHHRFLEEKCFVGLPVMKRLIYMIDVFLYIVVIFYWWKFYRWYQQRFGYLMNGLMDHYLSSIHGGSKLNPLMVDPLGILGLTAWSALKTRNAKKPAELEKWNNQVKEQILYEYLDSCNECSCCKISL